MKSPPNEVRGGVGHSQSVIHKREKHIAHIKLVNPSPTSVKIDTGREEIFMWLKLVNRSEKLLVWPKIMMK